MAGQYTFKNKKALVFGLGLLGGGVATTKWLLDNGARVTVTDMKDDKALASSVRRVEEHLKKTSADGDDYERRRARLAWALGGHSKALIDAADIVVVNPDVPFSNALVQYALKKRKKVANEGTIFYDAWRGPLIGVTGTRGKTTTATWISHLIANSTLAGNSTTRPFLSAVCQTGKSSIAVTELSSFVLEHFERSQISPHVAVITNIYRDHLNRHGTMRGYACAKAAIFAHQGANDWLVLNRDNHEWTEWVLRQRPKSRVRYTSLSALPPPLHGIWCAGREIWQRDEKKEGPVLDIGDFRDMWGAHNVANLLAASLAAHLAGASWKAIQGLICSVPQVSYRQEVVHKSRSLTVVNDTTATSPEGAIAALERWGGPNCILVAGGTDRDLDYRGWADTLSARVRPTNTILLAGSATAKMRAELGSRARGIRTYDTLERCWHAALARARKFISSVILFSPGAKSFELFANEFDRGQQFNALVENEFS